MTKARRAMSHVRRPAARKSKRPESDGGSGISRERHPLLHFQQVVGNATIARMVAEREIDPLAGVRSVIGPEGGVLDGALAAHIRAQLGMGAPIEHGMRRKMEDVFQTDLSDVRIHTDSEASELSQMLGAKAFTFGKDVFFHKDASPHDPELLTHELTHVVQQDGASSGGTILVGPANDPLEHQAEHMASEVSSGVSPTGDRTSGTANSVVQRGLWDFLSAASGPVGLTSSVLTGLAEQSNRPLAQLAGVTAKEMTAVPAEIGIMGKLASPIGLASGLMDLFGSNKSVGERISGGLGAYSGLTGVLGDVGELFGTTALSAGGAEGLSAGAGMALSGELGAGVAASSAGAVVGAGLAGYGLGRLLDEGVGAIGQAVTGNRNKDYTLSGRLASLMTSADRSISSLWADPNRPAYTQTIGWKLAQILPRWMQ